jgi:hypothetical protein
LNPITIIEQAERHGALLYEADGKLRAAGGSRLPEDLAETIKDNRTAILASLAESGYPGRWCKVPSHDLPLAGRVHLTDLQLVMLKNYVLRQTCEARAWVDARTEVYAGAHPCPEWSQEDIETAACLDLVLWQREPHLNAPERKAASQIIVRWLEGLTTDYENNRHE